MEVQESSCGDKIDILLVDDRSENLFSLEAVLTCPEYNLISVASGDEALKYLLDHTPALILMDVQMPDLNGFQTASILKGGERTREIPIIFVTAINKGDQFIHKGYQHGAVDYIYKPYDAHVLRAKVAVFVDIRKQHARVSRLVSVQQAATQALAQSKSVEAAISSVLRLVCTSLKWDLGLFWQVDKGANLASCHTVWQNPARPAPEFVSSSLKIQFNPGVDIPGRVWSRKRSLWISDVSKEANFPRLPAASQEFLHTAVAVPVFVDDETMGILEFYSRSTLPDDSDLVKIMSAIGSQVGQVLKSRQALESVRVSEARKAAIMEAVTDGVVSLDQEAAIVEFNTAAEEIFARGRSSVIGKEFTEVLVSPAYRVTYRDHLKEFLLSSAGKDSLRIQTLGVRGDGSELPIEITMNRVSTLEPPLFTGLIRDITELKQVEDESAFLVEASSVLSSTLNFDATFLAITQFSVQSFANWCCLEMADTSETSRFMVLAHRDTTDTDLANRLRSHFQSDWHGLTGSSKVIRTGRPEFYPEVTDSNQIFAAQDSQHLESIQAIGIQSSMILPLIARSHVIGAITLISTHKKNRYTLRDLALGEELARRAAIAIDNAKLYRDAQEAIRARDEFFSIASHELRTPISALKMSLQLSEMSLKPKDGLNIQMERLSRMLTVSCKQVDRLTHLVDDLLDVVKIRAGKLSFSLSELNLSNLVMDVADQYADALDAAKCSLELSLEPTVVGVWDHTRIEQVVINLVSNAIKYAPGNPIRISVTGDDRTGRLTVQDFGPGIAQEQQAKIFERFERVVATRNVTGLGLGLFIVKQIIEAHQGTISLDSQEGKGSTFIVELPRKSIVDAKPTDLLESSSEMENIVRPLSFASPRTNLTGKATAQSVSSTSSRWHLPD